MKRQFEKNNQNILVFAVDACSLTVQKACPKIWACLMSMCWALREECAKSSSKGHQVAIPAFSPACLQSFSRIRKMNVNKWKYGNIQSFQLQIEQELTRSKFEETRKWTKYVSRILMKQVGIYDDCSYFVTLPPLSRIYNFFFSIFYCIFCSDLATFQSSR